MCEATKQLHRKLVWKEERKGEDGVKEKNGRKRKETMKGGKKLKEKR